MDDDELGPAAERLVVDQDSARIDEAFIHGVGSGLREKWSGQRQKSYQFHSGK